MSATIDSYDTLLNEIKYSLNNFNSLIKDEVLDGN